MVNIMDSISLFDKRVELKNKIDDLKAELKSVEEKLSETFMPAAKEALNAQGKDFGTAHFISGNNKFKAVLRKKVTWDQNQLRNVFNAMDPDDAAHYAKVTFAVEERKYTTAPPAIRSLLEECRTVEVGGFSLELEK